MKREKIILNLLLLLCLLIPMVSFARDTDIYMASGEGVEPNILIIFDNSGSMGDVMVYVPYDPSITYAALVVPTVNRDVVYKYDTSRRRWVLYGSSESNSQISNVPCLTARNALMTLGQYTGNTNSTCSSNSLQLRTGNYRNYWADQDARQVTKLEIAQDTIKRLIDSISGVRVGIMIFNPPVTDTTSHGGSSDRNSHGGKILSSIVSLTSDNKTTLKGQIDAITADTWTPLAETLYEAGLYFKGGPSYFNSGVTYVSPIQYSCQKNFIIYMTDGDPTRDDGYRPGDTESSSDPSDPRRHNHILKQVIGDRDGDGREPGGSKEVTYIVDGANHLGTDYLDDVAKYLYESDLRSDLTGTQNIITYTIGFAITPQHNLLGRAGSHGGGKYYQADNAEQLATAFQHIVGEVLEQPSSFLAPIVPVSRMERASAGDKLYLALFQPNQNKMWSGNIKKFNLNQPPPQGVTPDCSYNPALPIGTILDSNCSPALNSDGMISDNATSYWVTDLNDGPDVEKGGVGKILKNRSSSRNIYTYLGSNTNLTHSSNAFNTTNITRAMLGVLTDIERDNLVQFVHGYDAYYENEDDPKGPTVKRDWVLGSFLHSRPLVTHYGSGQPSYIFAGSNDGMLHAFNDDTGEEAWAFVPPNLLNQLQALRADVNAIFVDGSPRAYITRNSNGSINQAILIFGLRRGGNRYYALDVTNPTTPRYLWEINPDAAGSPYAEMGQTWSAPNIGKIAFGTGEKWVAFIGGGYDTNQDNDPVTLPDSKGRAVYIIDVTNGSLVKRFSNSDPGYSSMTFSIPSDIARVDINGDGKIDRLYVGDLGGRMWRFDIADPNPANWSGRIIFQSNPGNDGTTGRKIFYPPDVTLEKGNYEILFFGTGDREHPQNETVINRLYAVKDKNVTGSILNENNLYDVTTDELQSAGTTEARKNEILTQLNMADGWLIKLNLASGEKSLSSPVLFYRVAYFTTYIPRIIGDPCQARFGTARMYALDYKTGNAVFNFDLTNDTGGEKIERSDRSENIGGGIPSGVIITFIQGISVAYTGVGGGVDMPPLPITKSLMPIYWRTVF
jgi:type IV pilus assembly protein PilY1